MPRDAQTYLYEMLDGCEFLLTFIKGRTADDYDQDRGFRSAIERELQNIGEALMQLHRQFPEIASQITDYREIIGFRHVLVHGYFSLESNAVWHVLKDELPTLRQELGSLI